MSQDSASGVRKFGLRIESVPFSEIPGQSHLFADYQSAPLSLSKFYPSVVGSYSELVERVPQVLDSYSSERGPICDALERINRSLGSGEKTFENIELLRSPDSVAIVTGQQAGLFTGPLYTIYKALSVVKLVDVLRARGVNAVPVFWVASEDHDFEEVSNAFFLRADGELEETAARPAGFAEGRQIGFTEIDSSIAGSIGKLLDGLPKTEFTGELGALLSDTWAEGSLYSSGFAGMLASILSRYGIIIFDPVDSALKNLAGPIYSKAIERSAEIVSALIERDRELASAGYHSQVLVTSDYFPLFIHDDAHTRHSLKKTSNGAYKAKGSGTEFTVDQLAGMAADDPTRFSPTVVLRPVVQDCLLPTLCYFGGGAEIAYFAQNSEVYRVMERPVTPILHRQSFTVVEPRHNRILEKYELEFTGLFSGREKIIAGAFERFVDPKLAETFSDVESRIGTELDKLDKSLAALDPTLADSLRKRRRKIAYHISALRQRSHSAKTEKSEILHRQIGALLNALLPGMHLQERTLNIATFLNSHGPYFIDWIYDAIDLDDKGHRVIYL